MIAIFYGIRFKHNDYIILCTQHAIDRAKQRFGWGIGELKANINSAIKKHGLKTTPDIPYIEFSNGIAKFPTKKIDNYLLVVLTTTYYLKPPKQDGKLKFGFVDKRRYKPKHYR